MRRVRRAARQAASLAGAVRGARRAYGAGAVGTLRRARALRGLGFEYDEAMRRGLLDPRMPEAEWRGHVSEHVNTATQRLLNGEDSPALVTDKVAFYLYCRGLGLPAPELLAILHVEGDGWSRPDRVLRTRGDWAEAARGLPDEWVIKPSTGFGGAGVRVLVRDGERLTGPAGDDTTLGGFWDALRAEREFTSFVVQERLRNHPELAEMGGGEETLHTVRLCTLVRRDGGVEIPLEAIKFGLAGTGVDNIRKGRSGNVAQLIGPGGAVVPAAGGPARAVPLLAEARAMVCDAARHFPALRTLGWDVAITPDGPRIVEANAHWGMDPGPHQAALFERLRTA